MTLEFLGIILHVILQGLIYSFVVMGVYISSRVVHFDDLTTEGSFGLGGAIAAILVTSGVSGWLAIPVASLGGAAAGAITGLLHTKLKMNNLISGLVMTTALFSICLKLASSNMALPQQRTIFVTSLPISSTLTALAILIGLASVVYTAIKALLASEVGLILKALGCNPQVVTSLGKSVHKYKIFALAVANGLIALAGCLFVQWNGFFSITGNVGTLVIGLAGLIIAEMLCSSFSLALLVGAIFYQGIFAITIELQLEPKWNNLIKALLIVLLVQIKPPKKNLAMR